VVATLAAVVVLPGCVTVSIAPDDEPAGPGTTSSASPSEQAATVDPAGPGTIVMWGRDSVHAATVDDVRGLDGVIAAAFTRSDTVGLVGTRAADGSPVTALEPGWQIPVEVAAVDPADHVAIMDEDADAAQVIAELQPGQALLSQMSSELRGVGTGGRVDLAGLADLLVVGVVPDGAVGRAEVVIHRADADAAGLEPDGSIILRHDRDRGAATDDLVATIGGLFPEDAAVRVFDADADTEPRRAPLILSLPQVKARFGEFAYRLQPGQREVVPDPAFVDDNIVDADMPLLGSVQCHRLIIDDLRAALQQIVDDGFGDDIDPSKYAGCFYPRRISTDGASLSRHSWGIAIDINVDLSLPGLGVPPRDAVVDIFGRHGFRWGGDFLHPDNHHFEWVGEAAATRPTPQDSPT
jgi:hypothetical protein